MNHSPLTPHCARFLFNNSRPVTAPAHQIRQLLQPHLIDLVEPVQLRTVHIDDSHHPIIHNNGNHNLALAVAVAGDVAGKGVDVGNELSGLGGGCGTAYAPAEGDGLAGYFTLKRA